MRVRIFQALICAASLIAIQGCFSLHSTTVKSDPPTQTTTVYHVPAGEEVAVITTK